MIVRLKRNPIRFQPSFSSQKRATVRSALIAVLLHPGDGNGIFCTSIPWRGRGSDLSPGVIRSASFWGVSRRDASGAGIMTAPRRVFIGSIVAGGVYLAQAGGGDPGSGAAKNVRSSA